MFGLKKDLDLLSAAGGKQGFDIKKSLPVIIIVIALIAVMVLGLISLQALNLKNSLQSEIATYENTINNNTYKEQIRQIAEKTALKAEIDASFQSGNNILQYTSSLPSMYVEVSPANIEFIKNSVADTRGCIVDNIRYDGSYVYFEIRVSNEDVDSIEFVSDTVVNELINNFTLNNNSFKPFKTLLVVETAASEDESVNNKFTIRGELRNVYELITYSFDSGITFNNFSYNKGVVTFTAVTQEAYPTHLLEYQKIVKDSGCFIGGVITDNQPSIMTGTDADGNSIVLQSLGFTLRLMANA